LEGLAQYAQCPGALAPYAGAAPDEYLMARLGQTDAWYKNDQGGPEDATLLYACTQRRAAAPPVARHRLGRAYHDRDIGQTGSVNPKRWRDDSRSVDAPEFRGSSVLEMPDAPPQPWIARRPGVPAGRVEKHQFKSVALKNEREIAVLLPPQYSPHAEPYPLLVLFDEHAYLGEAGESSLVPTPTILDNLISEARIRPWSLSWLQCAGRPRPRTALQSTVHRRSG